MKKVLLLGTLAVMATTALAGDFSYKAQSAISSFMITPQSSSQTWGANKSRLSFTATEGDTSLFYQIEVSAAAPAMKYLFATFNYADHKIKVGQQRYGIVDYAGGSFASGTLRTGIDQWGNGITVAGEMAGLNVKFGHLGNVFVLDDSASYDGRSKLLASVNQGNHNVGVAYSTNSGASAVSGLSLWADTSMEISGVGVAAQIFYDLNDDAALANDGVSAARQHVGLFATYGLGDLSLYADYLMALNASSPIGAAYKSYIGAGAGLPLNDVVTLWAELTMTVNSSDVSSTGAAISFDLAI
jgi:hypothetical protein